MTFCSVQDAVNLLTLFKYLLVLIVSLLNKTSIDGSIFLLVLLVLFINISKNLLLSFLKAGAKVRALFLTTKLFRKFFVLFFKWDSTFSLSQFVKAFFSWKAGAKVRPFGIHSKYIKLFFLIIFEYIC